MRFLRHEHADVTKMLEAYGVDPKAVLFVKRRGRVHVQIPGRRDTFSFFRKRSTTIGVDHEWQHRTDYYLAAEKAKGIGSSWEEVKSAFGTWLSHR